MRDKQSFKSKNPEHNLLATTELTHWRPNAAGWMKEDRCSRIFYRRGKARYYNLMTEKHFRIRIIGSNEVKRWYLVRMIHAAPVAQIQIRA